MNMQMTPDTKPNTSMPSRPGKILRTSRVMTNKQKKSYEPMIKKLQFDDIDIFSHQLAKISFEVEITNVLTTSPVRDSVVCPICCVTDTYGSKCDVDHVCQGCFFPFKATSSTSTQGEAHGVVWDVIQ